MILIGFDEKEKRALFQAQPPRRPHGLGACYAYLRDRGDGTVIAGGYLHLPKHSLDWRFLVSPQEMSEMAQAWVDRFGPPHAVDDCLGAFFAAATALGVPVFPRAPHRNGRPL